MLLQYCLRLWQSICWYYVNSISSIIECVLSNLIIVQFWILNSASTYILFSSSKPVKLNASIKLHSNSALKHDSTKSPVKKSPLDKSHHPHNTAIKKEAISPVSFVIFILLCTQPNRKKNHNKNCIVQHGNLLCYGPINAEPKKV